ncbi:FHA domain-containing protein At4g14490-like [Solanum pennellii]|uniref:FHA domain-containing protein At4g14490-like n=1 Tax=Solanum pennellii TaxID=28526 RepID=A0ABM1HHU9_SOLPN|nr:FHA domain-containing protein At4g14490-like [Solanum pennellii]XP_027775010.1 FHA domain-containing protein At4g14490-like [Solanum pennellii]
MEEGEGPLLHLIMEKGPLSGSNLVYKPGSKIQIGRGVRGNSLPIKDEGISSKHLRIQFESGLWVINDLGSSNGTFLNTIAIDPSRPTKLTDGDIIKIGEETSIKVKIEVMEVDQVEEIEVKGKNTRRNARRGKGLGVIDENRELGLGNGGVGNVGVGSKRATRSCKNVKNEAGNVDEVENFTAIGAEKEGKGNPRRTRGSSRVESVRTGVDSVKEAENSDLVDIERETKQGRRRPRGSKKADSVKDGDDAGEETESLAEVEAERQRKPSPRRTRGSRKVGNDAQETDSLAITGADREKKPSPRRTRGSKKAQNVKWTDSVEEATNSVAIDVDKEKKVCSRRTRSSRKEEDVETLHKKENVNMELKQLGKGKGSTASIVHLEEDEVMEKLERDQKDCEEAVESSANVGVERNMPEVVETELQRDGCEGLVSNVGANMSEVQMEEEVDLEKMTLGEWLDYLEIYLPKQIIDATEEMILGMKQKAEKYQEFMLQQKNAKDCDGTPKG